MITLTIADVIQKAIPMLSGNAYTVSMVILYDQSSKRALPIWIEIDQALSIVRSLKNENNQRQNSHNLIISLLSASDLIVTEAIIGDIIDNIYSASIRLNSGKGARSIESRVSDAIIIATKLNIPIRVTQEIWHKVSVPIPNGKLPNGNGIKAILDRMSDNPHPNDPKDDILAEAFR